MRIDHFVYPPPRRRPEHVRSSKPDFEVHDDLTAQDPRLEDVVQLTLGRDGIWEVKASSQADDPATFTSAPTFSPVFPRVSRLSHALLHVYSPAGITPALGSTRGLLVDLYA